MSLSPNLRLPSARLLLGGLLAFGLASCTSSPTAIELALDYDEAWGLTELEVRIGERVETTAPASSVALWVPDGWSGAELQVQVLGLRDGARVAAGRALVIPRLGEAVRVELAMARAACGAWCVEGATACLGDEVVRCALREDGCHVLEPVETCPEGCSLGACRSPCIDECAMGEVQCDGPAGLRECGQGDSDECLDWLPPAPCGDGQSCAAGQCVDGCADACDAEGDTTCRSGGAARCGDRDLDGCLEWGPPMPCGAGASCEDGACVAGCEDECTKDVCAADSERTCGQFDEDPCLDLSPGVSCRRPGTCEIGTCGADGCEIAPVVCDAPPASACVDDDTLRTYAAAGTCDAGVCEYTFEDRDCPSCPACDPCAGVVCDTPPSPTCVDGDTVRSFASAGTCETGRCSYAPTDRDCDSPPADSCVDGDTRRTFSPRGTCADGSCGYVQMEEDCDTPPAPTCVDPSTRRVYASTGSCSGGACDYAFTDEVCPAGCVAGACSAVMCRPFGTDAFGYSGCSVSMPPAALPCPDIRGVGTATGLGDDDETTVPLGFDFDFYGTRYAQATIQSNGALTFGGSTGLGITNACLPHSTSLAPLIAAFWDDLDPSEPGAEVTYQTRGSAPSRTFQVQWDAPVWRSFGGGDPGSFAVVLHESDGRVELCYADVDFDDRSHDRGASATVGIQGGGAAPASALSFSCDTDALSDGLYLELTAP